MNYHYEITGPDVEVLEQAIKKCASLAVKSGIRQLAIAVHSKNHLTSNTIVKAFGEALVNELNKRNIADLNNFKIYLITEKIPQTGFKGPILAPHVSIEYLNKILSRYGVTDVIYIPWTPDELKEYLSQTA